MSYQIDLSGHTALVTGASSGFGEHFARVLAGAGANVVLAARRKDRIEALAADIGEGKAGAVVMDVTDPGSVRAGFEEAEKSASLPDIIINNAGVARPDDFLSLDEEDWTFLMGTNFDGVRQVAKEASSRLVKAGKAGSIINIASILALGAQPQQTAYAASKAAVLQLTRVMALELFRHSIRVNALCPGYFSTELNDTFFESEAGKSYIARTPGKRLGRLSELDLALLMYASPESSFTTGSHLEVDGGHSVRLV